MKYLITGIDIFGYTPSLTIIKQPFYVTFFGGSLTIILILTAIITIIFSLEQLIDRNSPSVNLSTESYSHPSKLTYFNNFEFIIGIQNSDFITEINEKIFQAKGTLFKTYVNESGIFNVKSSIKLTSCDIALINSTKKDLFDGLNLKGYYCISPEQSEELYIKERWGNNEFTMIQIKFVDCDNSTGNCASESEIYNFLHSADLSFYMVDNLISTKKYKNPFSSRIKQQSFKVSDSYKISFIQYIRHIRIESDDNFFLTSNNSLNSFTLNEFTSNTVFERDSDTFMSLSIELDNTIEKYQRKYYKIQDLGAQVGGIFNILYMIIAIILKLYEKNSYFEFLINNFFEVRLDEFQKQINLKNHKNKKNTKKHRSIEINKVPNSAKSNNTINNTANTNSNTNVNGNITETLNNDNEKKYIDNRKIKFSFFDKLILLKIAPQLSRAKKDKIDEIFFMGTDYVMNNLDVISYLRRSHSIDMQLDLLMGEDQQKIFQYITKPILSLSFLGTRYNVHNLPSKIKLKLLERNSIVNSLKVEYDGTKETSIPNSKKNSTKNNKRIKDSLYNTLDD